MPPLLQQANIDRTEDISVFQENLHHYILVRKNPNHCIPHNHSVSFTLSGFNAYCIKYHILILILGFLHNIPQLF